MKKKRSEIKEKIERLKKPPLLSSFERVSLARHPDRPRAVDFIEAFCKDFVELAGDRLFRNDFAVVGGFARLGSIRCMVIAQEKGKDTESRLHRNFGMVHPEGFRKALRLAQLAEKFNLPVVFLVDTPGAYPGCTAEERGQGWAIATNLKELFRIRVPIVVVIIGEGCSGGALGMGIGDAIGMAEHAYFSVISPESCASILYRDAKRAPDAAQALRLHSEDMLSFGIIDEILHEGQGAHLVAATLYAETKEFIIRKLESLLKLPSDELLRKRYERFRKIGSHVVLSLSS